MNSTIQIIPRHALNEEAYTAAIHRDKQAKIYAEAWYLDAATPNWKAAVWDNYRQVAPLPMGHYKRIFRAIQQPWWVNSLGIFGDHARPTDLASLLHFIDPNYWHILYSLYHDFTPAVTAQLSELWHIRQRTNFVLDTNRPYADIHASYKKSLRKSLAKHSDQLDVNTLELNLPQIQSFIVDYFKINKIPIRPRPLKRLVEILRQANQKNALSIYSVTQGETHLAQCAFLTWRGRLYNRMSYVLPAGRKLGAGPVLKDYILQHKSPDITCLDFEGSDLPGVRAYLQSFGPTNQPYYVLERKFSFPKRK